MRPAPVRRLVAFGGLVALIPIALRLYSGVLTPVEAALRATVVLAVVVVVTRMAGWGLRMVLAAVEKDAAARRAAVTQTEARGGQ